VKSDFPPGTTMTAEDAAKNDSVGLAYIEGRGWFVYVTQPDRSIYHYSPDDAEKLANALAADPVLNARFVPALRQLAADCRLKTAATVGSGKG